MDADVPRLECAVVQSNGEFPSPKSWCEVVHTELCRRIYYSHPGAGLVFNFKNHEGIKFVCLWDGEATHADGTRVWQCSAFRKDRSLALRTVYVRQVPQAGLVLQCKLEIRAGAEDSNFVMNFTSMSGNSLGKAVHELNTLPHRVSVQYVRHLAKEWAWCWQTCLTQSERAPGLKKVLPRLWEIWLCSGTALSLAMWCGQKGKWW